MTQWCLCHASPTPPLSNWYGIFPNLASIEEVCLDFLFISKTYRCVTKNLIFALKGTGWEAEAPLSSPIPRGSWSSPPPQLYM